MLRSIILLLSMLLFGTAAMAQIIIGPTTPKPAPTRPPVASGPSAIEIERAAFNACAAAKTPGPCRQYLARYPRGSWADIARGRISDLEAAQTAPRPALVERTPAPTVDREPQFWAACDAGTTVAACEKYLGGYPSGRWAVDARAKIAVLNAVAQERASFAQCQASTAPGLCETFIATYPNSSLVAAAKAQIGVIAGQAAQRDAAARAQAAADQDRRAFAACDAATASGPCEAYLASFPTGASAAAARLKIGTLAASQQERTAAAACLNGVGAAPCEQYLATYPSGSSAAAARARLTGLKTAEAERAAWAQCQTSDVALPCERYLAAYPAGASADAARTLIARINSAEQERTAWALCEAGKTAFPCEKYLASFATGRYADAARTRIKVLETAETEPEMVPALGLVVKRSDKGEFTVVSVQQFSSAMGNVFGGDVILKINDQPANPRETPRAALERALAAASGRVKLLIRRGPAAVTAVIRARP
ncbi:hypothetical protein [Polymorphobacter fuscus]|uniref:PDZ domain-containing protein n=1 Tax=Sandarakinorhabdus fusca TaxID=1439888 RepID=A0A7C9GMB5_9SPHN|nr:hypothetical protein [Polymorphobacter fuscus]KAB7648267.1 hypothetical protein F9290_00660 [Polymorphobacter fuscus]MQT15775.1 hypothetical protein [Polymorphobacter fuscus]NJC07953.1 outer membrane protein assembly factor BamD (BamD/ComL family) [Polymorphobacter fuscus]